jgi:serine phosphatase RsbU (regulator of sigma subunit)
MDFDDGLTLPHDQTAGGQVLPTSLELPATAVDVAAFIARCAAACVGADYSNIALLDDTGSSLRLFHGSFLEPAIADRYTDVPLEARYPIAAAVRSGDAVFVPDLDSYRTRFPDILADTIAAGVEATASLPLFGAEGVCLGAIGFAWADPPPFDAKLERALTAVALLCTETLERARRYDEEHQIVIGLQQRMLEDLPHCEGIEVAARYLPAGDSAPVGGDWYQGLRLGDGRVAFVVGDVAGHGITAAADMALIRGMISALLHSGVAVADVLSEVSGTLAQRKGLILASAALVVVDVAAETLTFTTAGHPPPVVVDQNGTVRLLDSANAPLMGLDETFTMPEAPRRTDTSPFAPGSRLVLFTDGLVERRDRSFAVGLEQMVTLLTHLRSEVTPVELVDSLLDALVGGRSPSDDIAIVVVEHLL